MFSEDTIRSVLPLLFGLPIAAGIAFALLARLGKSVSAKFIRGLAVAVALAHLLMVLPLIAWSSTELVSAQSPGQIIPSTREYPVFLPRCVPGDSMTDPKTGAAAETHATSWNLVSFAEPKADGPKVGAIQFFVGIDGLNVWLIALSSLMMVPVVLVSNDTIRERVPGYFAWLFLLQAGIVGVFLAFDIVLFYVCFELTLVPLFFLIGSWGTGSNRREAARKVFLYTLLGGLLTLLGIVGIVLFVQSHSPKNELTFSIPRLASLMQDILATAGDRASEYRTIQYSLFLALIAGFAVKIPIFPLHTWLPGAYSEAPIGVTVMLSALMAKMGTFGLVRLCLPLAPDATIAIGLPIVGALGAVGIIYGALCAYAQTDLKKLIAYSSVSHLGFCVLAIVAFNTEGIAGGVLHMVNHGLSTGAMFLVAGYLLRRYTSSQIFDYSGIWAKLPRLTFFMMIACLASVGLPGLNNFVSEMLMLAGVFKLERGGIAPKLMALAAGLGIFLSAWYVLTMTQRVFFGPVREPLPVEPGPVKDLTGSEMLGIVPLTVAMVLLGLFPSMVLETMKRDVNALSEISKVADRRVYGTTAPPAAPKIGPEPKIAPAPKAKD